MKKLTRIFILLIISAALQLSVLPFNASATPYHTLTPEFSSADSGELIISLYLPEPQKLTSIDFSIILTSDTAKFISLSTENTDIADKLFDFENIPNDTETQNIFTYSATVTEKSIKFSGFFLESLSSEDSFHLCDISISTEDEFAESDILELSYILSCETCSKTERHIYSLLKRDISDTEDIRAFISGDSNLDGKINASDARHILRASVGLDTLSPEESPYSDSDYDGKISASDARYALRASVGLEKAVIHCFDISLPNGEKCEDGGDYTFTCKITGISFTMTIANGGHICHDTGCFNTGKCEVCNEVIYPATGHKFDDNGICFECGADKALLDATIETLIPVLEAINLYDTAADEALQSSNYLSYIENIYKATENIKIAADICKDIIGLEEVEAHLLTAYKIRFQAFVSVMDNDGKILSTGKNCETLLQAVKKSNVYIDYASFLYS